MTTTPKKTASTKEWKPNEKQNMFLNALKVLGEATFRVIKNYILENNGETIATGSVNVLTTKQYVGSKDVEFNVETTTVYHYPTGDITEKKTSKKVEKVYYLINEADRETFTQKSTEAKAPKEDPAEVDLDDVDLVDMED